MPEAEAARHVGDPDEIELQELVDCVHRLNLGHRGSCGRELGLEWIARHCRSVQDTARTFGQQGQLLAQRGGDCGWHLHPGQGELGSADSSAVAADRACELPEVERIAPAPVLERRYV